MLLVQLFKFLLTFLGEVVGDFMSSLQQAKLYVGSTETI